MGESRFHRTNAPDQQELVELVHPISHCVAGFLEREGILEHDEENSYLDLEEGDEDPMQQVLFARSVSGLPSGRSGDAKNSRYNPSQPGKTMIGLPRWPSSPGAACIQGRGTGVGTAVVGRFVRFGSQLELDLADVVTFPL